VDLRPGDGAAALSALLEAGVELVPSSGAAAEDGAQ
jgi:hypothetical protein